MIPGDGLKFFPRITPIPESELVSQQQRRRRAAAHGASPQITTKTQHYAKRKLSNILVNTCNVQTSRFIS